MTSTIPGVRKAAVLLMQMGVDRSAQVLRALKDSEVEELMTEIARLEEVDAETVDGVLEEFSDLVTARRYYVQGGLPYAEEVLVATLGPERAKELLARLSASITEMPFEFLARVDPRLILSFLREEHPQTIALVLAHMPAARAAMVLSGLSEELQAQIAHRLAVMDRTSPDIVRQVEAQLERHLASVLQQSDYSNVGGLKPLVEIINNSDRSTERLILEGLERLNPVLAEEVRARMFMFEDIVKLDDRAVQLVLRQVDSKELATALKGVRQDVKDKIMTNMSERASAALADEIEVMGPVRVKQVEEAQAQIVRQIRALEEAGQIIISRGASDELVA